MFVFPRNLGVTGRIRAPPGLDPPGEPVTLRGPTTQLTLFNKKNFPSPEHFDDLPGESETWLPPEEPARRSKRTLEPTEEEKNET